MLIKCDTENEKEGNKIKLRKQLDQTVKGNGRN
jgi:hypothetical protein